MSLLGPGEIFEETAGLQVEILQQPEPELLLSDQRTGLVRNMHLARPVDLQDGREVLVVPEEENDGSCSGEETVTELEDFLLGRGQADLAQSGGWKPGQVSPLGDEFFPGETDDD